MATRPQATPQIARLNSRDTAGTGHDTDLEPLFVLGGPAYRLMQRIGIIQGAGPSVARRTVAFIAITWMPMLLFASLEGYAIGPTPRSSLLLDFAI